MPVKHRRSARSEGANKACGIQSSARLEGANNSYHNCMLSFKFYVIERHIPLQCLYNELQCLYLYLYLYLYSAYAMNYSAYTSTYSYAIYSAYTSTYTYTSTVPIP